MPESIHARCPHCDTLNRMPAQRLPEAPACGTCHGQLFTGIPIILTTERFDRHAETDVPLLADFWAAWCGPCRTMAPVFEAAAKRFEPRLRLAKIDSDAEPALAARYGIRAIPTLIMFHKGREIARLSGALPAAELHRWIEQNLAKIA